jgi:hypothetical protein
MGVRIEPRIPTVVTQVECAVYVLVHRDISDFGRFPLHPNEVFRAKIVDNAAENPYQSLSGFSAPVGEINDVVNQFLGSVGENSRAMVIDQFVDPLGFHPIP